ncbi:MAG: hypothetical protein V1787_05060 [Candidatus Micrarchaeota archaeon]
MGVERFERPYRKGRAQRRRRLVLGLGAGAVLAAGAALGGLELAERNYVKSEPSRNIARLATDLNAGAFDRIPLPDHIRRKFDSLGWMDIVRRGSVRVGSDGKALHTIQFEVPVSERQFKAIEKNEPVPGTAATSSYHFNYVKPIAPMPPEEVGKLLTYMVQSGARARGIPHNAIEFEPGLRFNQTWDGTREHSVVITAKFGKPRGAVNYLPAESLRKFVEQKSPKTRVSGVIRNTGRIPTEIREKFLRWRDRR